MRRGRLPQHAADTLAWTAQKDRAAATLPLSGINPINILSPAPEPTRGSRTEVSMGARAQTIRPTQTRSGEPVKRKMTMTPEPEDRLDATTHVVVNGPEGDTLDWRQIDWRAAEESVRRLRQRIFTASQTGDLPRVRNLQRLMLRSRCNTLLSVRRVTERNAGRLTAGVDGEVVLTPEAKADLAERVQSSSEPFVALPVRRVYIPKRGSSAKRRPLGIPVILDRCHQARVVNALEPEWEARFEPRSYGFRLGRGCHDAIEAIYWTAKGPSPKRQWCSTRTWPGRSTASATTTFWPCSARSPRGGWSRSG